MKNHEHSTPLNSAGIVVNDIGFERFIKNYKTVPVRHHGWNTIYSNVVLKGQHC